MMVRIPVFVLLILVSLYGCKKVIQVNLNDAAPQLIITGEVINGPGPYMVTLSQTVIFSADNVFPPVSGAQVLITDSQAVLTDTLSETTSGLYLTKNLKGKPGDAYRLTVTASGKVYTALSIMPLPVSLDSVTLIENSGFNNKVYNPVVNFQDPPGVPNYYQFSEIVNGRVINNIFIFDDRLSDGKYIRQPLFNDSAYIQLGNILSIGMYCIDKNVYNYFNTLQNATGNGFQSVAPSNPTTNISNGALGYFSAHTESRLQIIAY